MARAMGTSERTALVVEDEQHIRELVCLHLGVEGFRCLEAADGPAALAVVEQQALDVVILDLMLPGLDGLAVCRSIRRGTRNPGVPILMLTARREETDKVLGLETGADDYLSKPFGVRELVARVRALIRRSAAPAASPAGIEAGRSLTYRDLAMDPARRRVTRDGRDIELTTHEFDLLYVLLSHPGIVFSREALLARTWKENTFVTERSVDTLVKRVRRKVERDPSTPEVIVTVWGSGYKAADV